MGTCGLVGDGGSAGGQAHRLRLETQVSRQGREVFCRDPPEVTRSLNPRSSMLLSFPALAPAASLFILLPPYRNEQFCSWFLLLETGIHACLPYLEILEKREFFSFQIPFLFFSVCAT